MDIETTELLSVIDVLKTSIKRIPYNSFDIEIIIVEELLNVMNVLKTSLKDIPYRSCDIQIKICKTILYVMDVLSKMHFKTLTLRGGSDIEITICE